MPHERYAIDGYKVTTLRKALGWIQRVLAKKSGIAHRKIVAIEHNQGSYDYDTVRWLANALGVDIEELVYACDFDWRAVPNLPRRERNLVGRAIRLDMAGRHREAVQLCHDVLVRVGSSVDPVEYVKLHVRLLSMLSNAGEHQRALDECDALLAKFASLPRDLAHLSRWVRYRRGICLRRLGRHGEARDTFLVLLQERDDGYVASIRHQLGVLCILRAKAAPAVRARDLEEAVDHFRLALERWDEVGARVNGVPHRKGFTLLRLAETFRLLGRMAEAFDSAIEALHWLAFHQCDRYVEEVKAELRRVFRSLGPLPSAGPTPTGRPPRDTNGVAVGAP